MKYSIIAIILPILIFTANLSASPAQVIIIRHAEKPPIGNGLSLKGKERAAALAPYFTETEYLITNGPPIAIYAMAAPKPESSIRPIQTVTPLADLLNIPIKDSFERDDFKKMVEEIKSSPEYHGRTVLISWEHSLIPEIARAFGALQAPSKWSGDVYDRSWVITVSPNGKTTFQNHPQRLMYGDSTH